MNKLIKLFKPLVEKFPFIAELYRHSRNTIELNRKVEYRPILGFKFNGSNAMQVGEFEPEETYIFDNIIHHFNLFINIGANAGYYTLKALNKNIDVCAFEPNELNAKILLRNVHVNNFKANFYFFPIALSSRTGILPIYGASTGASLIKGWAGQTNFSLTPVNTFDNIFSSFIQNKNCFVLIDIEGAEYECLKGCMSLLNAKSNVVLLIEIAIKEHQPIGVEINPNLQKTFELLFNNDFIAFSADRYFKEITIQEIEKISKYGIDTLQSHNFLFIKKGTTLADFGLNSAHEKNII